MNAPETIQQYESQRAVADMKPVFKRVCFSCRGMGVGGHDYNGEFISTGSCRRCGGTGFIEYQVVNKEKV